MRDLPLIAITMGDPAGIGPEIILKALLRDDIYHACRPIILGDINVLRMVPKKLGTLSFHPIETPSEVTGNPGLVDIISISNLEKSLFTPGQPTVPGGKAMVDYIKKAVDLNKDGQVSAMVTCPISKELMHKAGYRFDGHTELLAKLTNTRDYVMMMAGESLRVSLATIHCALKEVPQRLNKGLILKTIRLTYRALKEDFAIKRPHLAVAGLNPHAGEAGLFGLEDKERIKPAVDEARNDGLLVDGPFPADTIFYHAINGKFDAVVAMYHDQGLIPVKLLNFSDSVNITLGLPIIRTSVDHGTAYDIAGKGVANPSSLIAAIKMAAKMVKARKAIEEL
ncbi:MAG: 4-hydroxythreonine-4-phosphate dehydrogenase PdxA [Deltaproteobacteria bacterium]|nr:MAG: 4-hydroxythreonine-4-phosphate dehydrogenase PdxA [Deltaproteobacteria bacterium]